MKEKYGYHDKIWFNALFTEYKKILREFNYMNLLRKRKISLQK
jgi:hypothetical protein